jgi:hypothetical protein
MRIVRSWPIDPEMIDPLHPIIHDGAEIVKIDATRERINYRPLIELGEDFIHMDWDIAIGRDELIDFAEKCYKEPDLVRAGPYQNYPTRRWRKGDYKARYTQWHAWDLAYGHRFEVKPGAPDCHYFGMGFVYMPFKHWKGYVEFVDTKPELFCCAFGFSDWYKKEVGKRIPLEWDTHLVHLNYKIDRVLDGVRHGR